MRFFNLCKLFIISFCLVFSSTAFAAGESVNGVPEARLLRTPAVGAGKIVFSYAGDLYSVDINGGLARRLTSDKGYEIFPRISPDGTTIAFTGQYDGNTEVYTMPVDGGMPVRVTYSASLSRDDMGDRMGPNNIVMTWTPDSKKILYYSRMWAYNAMRGALMLAGKDGGVPEEIPATSGGFCSFSPDGTHLAMNRMFREYRTWKHYEGGQADDIWLADLKTGNMKNLTNDRHQDIIPMYIGNEIYFLSDRDHTMNLFVYNLSDSTTTKLTDFTKYDIKFPSNSKDYIVFENGGYIYKYSVKDKKCAKVDIRFGDEGEAARPKWIDVRKNISDYSVSSDGKRIAVTARGDVFSVPANEGATFNITKSDSAHERSAQWSPDGKYIAYLSDATGEYELYIVNQNLKSQPIQLTNGGKTYKLNFAWAPDSKSIVYSTETKCLYRVDLNGKEKLIYTDKENSLDYFEFSPDSKWLAFSSQAPNRKNVIRLLNIASGKNYVASTDWYDSFNPVFSPDGKYLYFLSDRTLTPHYHEDEWNAYFSYTEDIFAIPLSKSAGNPFLIKNDECVPASASCKSDRKTEGTDKSGRDNKTESGKKVAKVKDIVIDTAGMVERTIVFPVESGNYRLISASAGKLFYSVSGGNIKSFDFKTKKVEDVADHIDGVDYSPYLPFAVYSYKDGGATQLSVVSADNFKLDKEKKADLSNLRTFVNYAHEWKQIFDESWRIDRDWFYCKNMNGVDWQAIHDRYAELLPYVRNRHELTYIIGEMKGELTVGHSYISSPSSASPEKIPMGLLGAKCTKDKDSGYFRITKIFPCTDWNDSFRSPLTEPGLNVKEGMYILSVNGYDCRKMQDIHEGLINTVGKVTELVIGKSTSGKDTSKIYIRPIADESNLAYYEWVRDNIRKVDSLSNGQFGYIHIPDMSTYGLEIFTKLFYTQLNKKALVIDDRGNGGGNVSPIIIEKLQRVIYRMTMMRNGGTPGTVPDATHYGPKVLLIDRYSASDGDLFPYSFKTLKLGKLVGERTWGGIVGISGSKPYLDDQDLRTPFFTNYSVSTGNWIVENHGVDPDVYVFNNPFEEYKGVDRQLEKAVEILKEEVKDYKPLPGVPPDHVAGN